MIQRIIRLAVCLVILLVQLPPLEAFDYDNPYNSTNINPSLPDYVRRPDANFQSNYFDPKSLRLNLIPDFNIDLNTLRLPKFDVRDIGNTVWTYQRENYSFNSDLKLAAAYSAKINVSVDGVQLPDSMTMDLSKMTYTPGSVTPTDFKQTYRDLKGASVRIERTHQVGEKNPSYESFKTFFANEERKNSDAKVPPAPSKELVSGYDETWRIKGQGDNGKLVDSNVRLSVDSMEYGTDLNRHLIGYQGTIADGKTNLSYVVKAPRDSQNQISSFECVVKRPGAPTVNVTWNPKEGTNPDQAFELLRDHLPVPVFVGPRSSFRFNGTDMAESPLKVTRNGDIASKQFGDAEDITALLGKEDLGIKVDVSAPDAESSKSRFSIGNALKNVWYMVTGKWADVKAMRQSLTSLRDTAPDKFLLAAGFSDPGFMGVSDLRSAISRTNKSDLSKAEVAERAKTLNQVAPEPTFFGRAAKVIVAPFKGIVEVVKTALSVVFGGRIKEEPIKGYDPVINDGDLKVLKDGAPKDMEFFESKKRPLSSGSPSAVFDLRHSYRTPPLLNVLPHFSLVKLAPGEKADHVGVYFNNPPSEFIEGLKTSRSIDLFIHGYNESSNKSLKMRDNFSSLMKQQNYFNINALISWSGDVGNTFFSKSLYFNRAVGSADLSWQGVGQAEQLIKSYNPDIKVNVVAFSLGARVLLNAADHGEKFGTVILLVPAVDNEVFSTGGKFSKAIQNIDQLVVVFSRNQGFVFGAYKATQFDRAAGAAGPSGFVNHPNFTAIDATKGSLNKWGMEVNSHGDIYEPETIKMLIDFLNPKH